jgi:hypothetical protein
MPFTQSTTITSLATAARTKVAAMPLGGLAGKVLQHLKNLKAGVKRVDPRAVGSVTGFGAASAAGGAIAHKAMSSRQLQAQMAPQGRNELRAAQGWQQNPNHQPDPEQLAVHHGLGRAGAYGGEEPPGGR